jgi:hypothetical protein
MQEPLGSAVSTFAAHLPIDLPVRRPERLPDVVQGQVHPAIPRIEPTTRVGRLTRSGTTDQADHPLTPGSGMVGDGLILVGLGIGLDDLAS